MDKKNKGRRFKTKSESPYDTVEAEVLDAAPADQDMEDRRRAKQSQKIEKMLSKKRSQEKPPAEEDTSPDAAADSAADEAEEPAPQDEPTEAPDERARAYENDERLKNKNAKKLEHLMQKKRRQEEQPDRDTPDDEEIALDSRPQAKKKSRMKRRTKRIILAGVVVVLLVALVFLFTSSDRLSMHNIVNFAKYGVFNMESDQRFPVQIRDENISPGNFCRMGQDLCYATGTKLETLNNYGVRMLTTRHGHLRPFLVCSDKYSLIYNLGSEEFQINSLDEHIYTGTAENAILVADIINNGTYALVTQSDGYLSKLFVYNSDNEKIFSYSFSEYYVTSVSLKSNGKMAVVSGVSAHNGTEISSLYVLDFTKEAPVQFAELEDTIVYDVQYLGSKYAAAVGSKAAYVIDTGDGDVERTDYEGKTLTAYAFNTDTDTFSISLSRSGDGRNCDVYSFSTSGSVSKVFSTDLRVISLSSYKNRVALLTTDMIYLYSKGGDLLGKAESGIDPKCVVLYTSSDAYVLDTSEIRSVSM